MASNSNYDSTSGQATPTNIDTGGVYIANTDGVFEKYVPYIYNGTAFEKYVPYIYNGSTWQQYS